MAARRKTKAKPKVRAKAASAVLPPTWFNLPATLTRLEKKLDKLLLLYTKDKEKVMSTLQDVINDVAAEKTQIDGLSTLTDGLQAQITQILQNGGVSPAVQAQIDQVFSGVEANKAEIVAAINRNTQPTPPQPAPQAQAQGGQQTQTQAQPVQGQPVRGTPAASTANPNPQTRR